MKARARLVAFLVAVPLSGVSAQGVYYEGGLSLASGNYIFTERTNTITLLTGLALQAGPVTLRATLPAYFQNTTLLAGSSAGLVPTGGSSSTAVADSAASRGGRGGRSGTTSPVPSVSFSSAAVLDDSLGSVEVPVSSVTGYGASVGDPTVGLTASVLRSSRVGVLVSVGAKVPVTDTSSYGTGAWDVGGSVSLSCGLGRTTMIGVDVAYWSMGDAPGLELQNSLMTSVSISHLTFSGWGFSASAFRASPVIDGFPSSASAGAGIVHMGARGSVGLNATVGLTETAPDVMIGLSWRVGLGR
jgi:hypothetical protein